MDFRNCLGMMASVSTLARSRGATRPVWTRNGCIECSGLRRQAPHVDEVARDGRGRGHRRAHEMRAPAVPLAALEVAVGRGRAALARLEAGVGPGPGPPATPAPAPRNRPTGTPQLGLRLRPP